MGRPTMEAAWGAAIRALPSPHWGLSLTQAGTSDQVLVTIVEQLVGDAGREVNRRWARRHADPVVALQGAAEWLRRET